MGFNKMESSPKKPSVTREQLNHLIAAAGGARQVEDIYPASALQQGLLFHSMYAPNSTVYVVSVGWQLRGELEVGALKRAWGEVLQRHALLRTAFVGQELESPLQVVHRRVELPLQQHDWRGLDLQEQQERLRVLHQADRERGFDFETPPLMRLLLIRTEDQEHRLIWSYHHALLDGWSVPIVLGEVTACYEAYRRQQVPQLAPVRPYREYIEWLQRQDLGQAEAYWRMRLEGVSAGLSLGIDRQRSAQEAVAARHAERRSVLPMSLSRLEGVAREHKLTVNTLVLGAWVLLLSRYSGSRDVVLGVTIAGRPAELVDAERRVGLFINTLPLRVHIRPQEPVLALLQELQSRQSELMEYQYAPLTQVHKWSGLPAGSSLFETAFVFENYPVGPSEASGRTPSFQMVSTGSVEQPHYALNVQVGGYQSLSIQVIYDTDRFESEAIGRLIRHLESVLTGIMTDPDRRCGDLPLLSEEERDRLLVKWNATQADYPRGRCLHELFGEQVQRTPEAVALIYEDRTLSYRELDRYSSQLAWYLQSLGVGPDVIVGVCLERSVEMVLCVLGVMKAGGAYLPLDPQYPAQRLIFMLEDTQSPVMLTQSAVLERVFEPVERLDPSARWVCMDREWERITQESESAPVSGARSENLAYVIYTSGSTGQPKGVMTSHSAIVNRLTWMDCAYGLRCTDRVLQKTPFSFDVSVWELFWPLLKGAGLVLARPEGHKDSDYLLEVIGKGEVSVIHFVPSMLSQFLESPSLGGCGSLRDVICSGEALTPEVVAEFSGKLPARLHNLYGPTEAAIDVSFWECDPREAAVAIGRPIANTQLYVLDEQLEPVPIGVAGELYIAGAGLARGYVHRPGLTAQRFIANAYGNGERLYRTGDRVRYRMDGNLEFLGRCDQQVKIRGYRIELGEVESALRGQAGVSQAVVVAREDEPGQRRLVGYVVGTLEESDTHKLRAELKRSLPEYMIPAVLVVLECLPLTANGKIDRQKLPAPQVRPPLEEYTRPRSPTEELLASIWREVLSLDEVGINDDFFVLGGHSLTVMRVIARAREVFGAELGLRECFDNPTLVALAQVIEKLQRAGAGISLPPLAAQARPQRVPLSHAQERLWFLDQLGLVGAAYNMSAALRLEGPVDLRVLGLSFGELIRRHESLRTRFKACDGEAAQLIDPPGEFHLVVTDLSAMQVQERERRVADVIQQEVDRRFDLQTGPLFRISMLQLSDRERVLLLSTHHIIFDEWSQGILVRELRMLYAAFSQGVASPLSEPSIQYADYACWQRGWLHGEVLQGQLAYWSAQLAGAPGTLELPTDRPRPAVASFKGDVVVFALSTQVTDSLKKLGRREGATLYMVLLAAFQVLLSRWSGQKDIVVASPTAGRKHRDTEGVIGLFVNTLLMRGDLSANPPFEEFLRRVKQTALSAYAHQDIPFEKLIEELRPVRDLSRQPLYQVNFTFQNVPSTSFGSAFVGLPGLSPLPLGGKHVTAKVDLGLYFSESQETPSGLSGAFEYATDLFDRATIQRLVGYFVTLLTGILADSRRRCAELPLLSPSERHQLLVEWNDTGKVFSREQCIHATFTGQVAYRPDAIAVAYKNGALTYGELDRRSSLLASYLQAQGVGPEVVVALCLERSPEAIIGLWGILKAGGAYLPLDPWSPAQRLSFMLEDANVAILLTREALEENLPAHSARMVCLDREWSMIEGYADCVPGSAVGSENLAYVIYTSGSSGEPKAVMSTHRGLSNLAEAQKDRFGIQPNSRILQFAALTFDASIWEIILALGAGATLYLSSWPADGQLAQILADEQITAVTLPPAALSLLTAKEFQTLQTLVVAGESCAAELGSYWASRARFINAYGPTESTVCASYGQWSGEGSIVPIGRPIANTQLYVLDEELEPVPIGVAGELYIAGAGLARGYLHRPGLTAQRFIANAYGNGERLYRTGDRVRYRADGNLEFLGRSDQQVKIRGYRIELEEVESALRRQAGVSQAVVVAREDDLGQRRLVAYVVGTLEQSDTLKLRVELKGSLPEYMIPAMVVVLECLPLTANGKIDRQKLPAPAGRSDPEEYLEPRTRVEEVLAGIWREVLRVDRVGVSDNFFELGGDSIQSIKMVALASQMGVKLTVRQVFDHQTIAGLANVASREEGIGAEQGEVVGEVALTPIQHWYLDEDPLEGHHYNQAVLLRPARALSAQVLEGAIGHLLKHHDALRLRLWREGDRWQQVSVGWDGAVPLEWIDLSRVAAGEQAGQLREEAQRLQGSLNLKEGPLLRAGLFDLGSGEQRLLLIVHHLAVDGVSWGILLEDLRLAYEQLEGGEEVRLPSKTSSFKSWSEHLLAYAESAELRSELSYWQLLGDQPSQGLPVDHASERSSVASVRSVGVGLSEGETKELLTKVPEVYHTQINDVLLTGLAQALRDWTGSGRHLIGLEGHGREELFEELELSRTVGWFTSLFPVVLDIEGTEHEGQRLRR